MWPFPAWRRSPSLPPKRRSRTYCGAPECAAFTSSPRLTVSGLAGPCPGLSGGGVGEELCQARRQSLQDICRHLIGGHHPILGLEAEDRMFMPLGSADAQRLHIGNLAQEIGFLA